MSGYKFIPLTAMTALFAASCGVTPGPAYDSTQDNPANYLPEKIVVIKNDKFVKADSAQVTAASPSQPAIAEPGTEAEYQAWLKARETGSDEYQEFLEYQDWLKFKRLNEASNESL